MGQWGSGAVGQWGSGKKDLKDTRDLKDGSVDTSLRSLVSFSSLLLNRHTTNRHTTCTGYTDWKARVRQEMLWGSLQFWRRYKT